MSAANILSVAIHRAAIEQELRESEKRLRIAKNSNNMGSFEYMLETGEVSWDQLLKDIWGIDKTDITMDDFARGVHPDDIDNVYEAIQSSTVASGDGHYMATYRVIHAQTKRISWIEATGQVLSKDDKPHKMIGMVIDITEKMKLETSLKAAVSKLQEANEKKNEFLATLGHEIRNPLAAIASGVQIIEQDKQQLARATSMIKSNVNIVSSLLDDLLDLTRISRGQIQLKKQMVNFNELLSEVYHSFLPQCERKHQTVTLVMPEHDIISFVDKTRIQQVFTNVISNSHKFTPMHGTIDIILRFDSKQLKVEIKDSGVGIDMQYRDKIFEPFQQLKQIHNVANTGMGIGLALVKQFIALHDGYVNIESEGLDTGTLFSVSLPIIDSELANTGGDTTKLSDDPLISKYVNLDILNVLVVDDNEDAAYGLSLILEMKGCQVHTCHTAQAALEEANEFKPNVLILDIGLPDMTGYDLLTQLQQIVAPNTLKIALTGFGHKKAREESKKAGFDYHMTKPVDIDNLVQILGRQATSVQGN